MPSRRWSRLALAVLLLWQLNAAVAVTVPHRPAAGQASDGAAAPCARHAHGGPGPADPAGDHPAPAAPDCCHDVPAGCHCAQLPALSTASLELAQTPPPGPAPMARSAPRPDQRTADFFRPPI